MMIIQYTVSSKKDVHIGGRLPIYMSVEGSLISKLLEIEAKCQFKRDGCSSKQVQQILWCKRACDWAPREWPRRCWHGKISTNLNMAMYIGVRECL
jgi:hypothetical protein